MKKIGVFIITTLLLLCGCGQKTTDLSARIEQEEGLVGAYELLQCSAEEVTVKGYGDTYNEVQSIRMETITAKADSLYPELSDSELEAVLNDELPPSSPQGGAQISVKNGNVHWIYILKVTMSTDDYVDSMVKDTDTNFTCKKS